MSLNRESNRPIREAGRRAFVVALRRALHHLYDTIELRRSKLLPMLGLNGPSGVSMLRRTLEDAIEALKPAPGLSPQSDAWRSYWILYHRYVEQFNQQSVAVNLGLSIRQLRRQEQLALHTLADWLIERHRPALDEYLADGDKTFPTPLEDADYREAKKTEGPPTGIINSELEWAERFFSNQQTVVDVDDVVRSVVQTIKPLIDAAGAVVHCDIPGNLPRALASITSVRQVVLNLILVAIQSSNQRETYITCGHTESNVWIKIQPIMLTAGQEKGLSLVTRLATISGGHLEYVSSSDAVQSALLTLPTAGQYPVLAIDDNADSLRLLERCLSNSRYHLIGTRNPAQALPLAEQVHPHAIILDVMLPDMDGWEVLGQLRENPVTRHIPVIVCTILPQEALALTLGAVGFIRKPISRERLLWELDHQTQAEVTKREPSSADILKAGLETTHQGM